MIVGDIVMVAMARLNGKDVLLLLEEFDQLRQQRRGILRGKPCRRRGLEPFGMVNWLVVKQLIVMINDG